MAQLSAPNDRPRMLAARTKRLAILQRVNSFIAYDVTYRVEEKAAVA